MQAKYMQPLGELFEFTIIEASMLVLRKFTALIGICLLGGKCILTVHTLDKKEAKTAR